MSDEQTDTTAGTDVTRSPVPGEVAEGRERSEESFESSLAAERVAERAVMRSIVKCVAIGIPLGIVFFTGLLFIAAGGDLSGWVVLGIGVTLGLLAAVLFGMLGGVTLAAHAFEDVDRGEPLHA